MKQQQAARSELRILITLPPIVLERERVKIIEREIMSSAIMEDERASYIYIYI